MITLTNVKGYSSALEEEKTIAQAVADMTYAFASADVPKINVITGEAYGSAYVAMNSKHVGADLVMALDRANVGVMDSAVAAKILCEDDIKGSGDVKQALEEKKKEFDALQAGADAAARRGYVDNIIEGDLVRKHLIYALQMFGMR